jgi:membrane-associated phospholipid phosphatase
MPTANRRTNVILSLCALAGFFLLTVVVLGFGVDGWDSATLRAVKRLHDTTLTAVIKDVTALGSFAWVAPLAAAMAVAALLLRRPRATALVILAVTGGELLQLVLKRLFGRPRPSVFPPLEHIGNAAYPSGHALVSAALACALVAICWKSRWRALVAALAAVYVLGVGFSRLYLGVHYPSDVLAGWLLAATWVAGLSALLAPQRRMVERARGLGTGGAGSEE